MKAFAISLGFFLVALALILCNAIYINRITFDMKNRLEELPDILDDTCAEAAAELRRFWEEQTFLVGLSVNYTVADRITEQAVLLAACAECGDLYGYYSAAALLRDAVEDMQRLEPLPWLKNE